jgi:hypothetical protein
MSEVIASAHEVSKLYWDDTKINCLSVSTRANKAIIFSEERHSKRGNRGIFDHT